MNAFFLRVLGLALFLGRATSQTSSNLTPINSKPGNVTSDGSASTNSTLQTTGPQPYPNTTSSTKSANNTDPNNLAAPNYTSTSNNLSASNTTTASNTTDALTNPSGVQDTILKNDTWSTNSSSTNWEVYTMSPDIEWKQANFTVHDKNGTTCYLITNQCKDEILAKKEFVVEDATTYEKKVKIDAHAKWCGFGQTYEASDHITFQLDPRAFLSDHWYIKTNTTTYVYKRAAKSLEGVIIEDNQADHVVATVSTSSSETQQLTLKSDGTIPAWDLIALLGVVRTRIHSCGY